MAMFQFVPFHFTQKIRKNMRNRNVSILYAFVICSLTCLLIITVTLNPDPYFFKVSMIKTAKMIEFQTSSFCCPRK